MRWIVPLLLISFVFNGMLLHMIKQPLQSFGMLGMLERMQSYVDSYLPYAAMPNFNNTLCFPNSPDTVDESKVTSAHTVAPAPILTLFTTFPDIESKRFIYENTIRNWHLLSPDVIPILFTDDDTSDPKSIAHYAVQQGWYVLPVPKKSSVGVPVIRHMYLEAQRKFHTIFYSYANCDILFDRNLTDTLRFLQTSVHNGHIDKLLLVGRRRNWLIEKGLNLTTLSQVGHYVKNSSMFISSAQDYFVSTRGGYPWTCIPDFVVGRVGYDNWLVATALANEIPVIDATETVTALHQTGLDGNFASLAGRTELNYNFGLARRFDYSLGYLYCAPFATQLNDGKITVIERYVNGYICNGKKVPFIKNPFTG